jgi:hypothetical protein
MLTISILGLLSVFAAAFVNFYFRYLVSSAKPTIKDLNPVFWFLDGPKALIIKSFVQLGVDLASVAFLFFAFKDSQYLLVLLLLISWFWSRYVLFGIRKYRGYNHELRVTEHILIRNIKNDSPETIQKHQKNFITLFWKNAYIYLVMAVPFAVSFFLNSK